MIRRLAHEGPKFAFSTFLPRYPWSIAGETSKRRMNSLHFFGALEEMGGNF